MNAELVEKSELDRRTNEYVLTSAGRRLLNDRAHDLAEPCGVPAHVADGGDRA